MFLSLILLLKSVMGVFLMLLLLPGARSVKLSVECKTFIERALEAWMKNPESFPCRVHGAFFGSPQDYHHKTPDIIILLLLLLTRGTSFEKVKSTIQNLKKRLDSNGIKVTSIYIDNCCQWRNLLQNVFGEEVCVKLDLFHAVQRIVSKIPKRGKKGSVIKDLRRRLKDELKLVFRDPSDLGKVRTKSTPSKQALMENLEQFFTKWNGVESDGEEILTQAAKKEIEDLKKKTLKMVVCATFQFRADQTEMKHFTRALRRTFHDRGSVSGWH